LENVLRSHWHGAWPARKNYEKKLREQNMTTLEAETTAEHGADCQNGQRIRQCGKGQRFKMAAASTVNARQATGPLDLLMSNDQMMSNLETRMNFFHVRVVDEWNRSKAK
jgi:hypothetical protein